MTRCIRPQDEAAENNVSKVSVTLQPEEPSCTHEGGHDWQAPHEIVGGSKENPGVWRHGAGVRIHEVCIHCGCGRVTDTWAQRPDTGEQGLTSIEYDPEAYGA